MKKLSVLTLILFTVAHARTIVVPDSAATIQAGLAMAGTGDTVLVMPGQYEENITWPSTDGIKLYSAMGPDTTTINGGGHGRVISIGASITRASEIRGFTIMGGKASSAAGMYVQGSPSIVGNRVFQNECHGERNYGGGIFCSHNTSPLIADNEITFNVCSDSNTWNYGGGLYIDRGSTAEITRNLIAANSCKEGYWNYGAGIYCGSGAMPVIYQNVITDNENKDGDRGHGAGIYSEGQVLVFCNLIYNNRNRSGSWNYGAGVKVNGPTTLLNNTIAGNSCSGGSWAYGGGVYVNLSDTGWVRNNIVAGNSAASGGGIYRFNDARAVIYNSYNDVWNNAGGNYVNCAAGTGSISEDPLFVTGTMGDYFLAHIGTGQPEDSPCVDAGDTLLMTSPLDLDSLMHAWTTRTDSGYDNAAIDMGYHYPAGVIVGIAEPGPKALRRSVTFSPNPFTRSVRFCIMENVQQGLVLTVSDAAGCGVRTVVSPGPEVAWDGRGDDGAPVTAGVYFCRLVAGDRSRTHRVVKLD